MEERIHDHDTSHHMQLSTTWQIVSSITMPKERRSRKYRSAYICKSLSKSIISKENGKTMQVMTLNPLKSLII